jgi:hypothetical protein
MSRRRTTRILQVGLAVCLASGSAAVLGASSTVGASAATTAQATVERTPTRLLGSVTLSKLSVRHSSVAVSNQRAIPQTGTGSYRMVDSKAATFHQNAGAKGVASAPTPVSSTNVPGEQGFVGMTGADQAGANGGADLEPPDQGLCAGQGVVAEFINNAFAVYSPSGVVLQAPIPSYQIFKLPSTAFLSDPRCYYDAPTQRWFLAEFIVGTVDGAGNETSPSVQYVAVSDTANVLGTYHLLSIDTTDVGVKHCPCFGDFDQLGADANGIYITTNEFPIATAGFNGGIIYAFSKELLENEPQLGFGPTVFTYRLKHDGFGQPYHVSPAQTPPGAAYAPDTEYFVESNSDANSANALEVYALTGTSNLGAPSPPTLLVSDLVTSEPYAFPPNATQKKGPIPLGRSVRGPEGQIEADFNAIQEVTYTAGHLYAELNTATVSATPAASGDGVDWFILKPAVTKTAVTATIATQGVVSAPGANSLVYPDIAVNAAGSGYLVFALSGPDYFPSAAYETFGPTGATGPIRIAQPGTAPEDSFTCYAAYVGPNFGGCRWGDYSMGVVMGGRVYLATEMVPPANRDLLTNWGTFIWSAPPS